MAPVSLPLTGLCVQVFHLSYNKNMNSENLNNSRKDERPFTCLWWHTYQRWHSQNFLASFVPLRINLQVDHPLEWAACILGMKAEGQSDLSYSSGSDNLWERKNGNVEFCVQHASLKFLRVFSLTTAIISNYCVSLILAVVVLSVEEWSLLRKRYYFRGNC